MSTRTTIGNDELILHVRKTHPGCRFSNATLGRFIWNWLRTHPGARAVKAANGIRQPSRWGAAAARASGLPITATQFEFEASIFGQLLRVLDLFGNNITIRTLR